MIVIINNKNNRKYYCTTKLQQNYFNLLQVKVDAVIGTKRECVYKTDPC